MQEPGQPLAYAPFDSDAPAECPCDELPGGGDPLRGPAGPPAWAPPVAWDADAQYVNGAPASAVFFGGSTYVALKDNQGVQPDTDPDTWQIIAAAGSDAAHTYLAATTVNGHRMVILRADGKVQHADPTDASHANIVRGMSTNAASLGGDVTVALNGEEISEPSWSWTPGEPVFLGLVGVLTQNSIVPGALFELSIGVAVSATKIVLLLDEPIFF